MSNNAYDVQEWRTEEYETSTRRYRVEVQQNLFSEWVSVCHWSGKTHRKGRSMVTTHESKEKALAHLEHIRKRRTQRGYSVIENKSA